MAMLKKFVVDEKRSLRFHAEAFKHFQSRELWYTNSRDVLGQQL